MPGCSPIRWHPPAWSGKMVPVTGPWWYIPSGYFSSVQMGEIRITIRAPGNNGWIRIEIHFWRKNRRNKHTTFNRAIIPVRYFWWWYADTRNWAARPKPYKFSFAEVEEITTWGLLLKGVNYVKDEFYWGRHGSQCTWYPQADGNRTGGMVLQRDYRSGGAGCAWVLFYGKWF